MQSFPNKIKWGPLQVPHIILKKIAPGRIQWACAPLTVSIIDDVIKITPPTQE